MRIEVLREKFRIDCGNCCGLCCVALFCKSEDGFPKDKLAGTPCIYLKDTFKCKIHEELKQRDMKGCMRFDCMGAGQYITQHMYHRKTWESLAVDSVQMYQQFLIINRIRQTLWYLLQAYEVTLMDRRKIEIAALITTYEESFENGQIIFDETEINVWQDKANATLKIVSEELLKHENKSFERKKDFIGKDMRQQNLKGKDFTMAYLMAADLRHTNLYHVNFLGADMRDTDIRGANLQSSFFLTQMQINSSKGDASTKLPGYLKYPEHWN